MASYGTEESSVENSQPYEIYRVLLGAQEFLLTSAEDTVTVGGDDYLPVEIKRTAIAQGKEARTKVLTVSISASSTLAQRYVGPPPGERGSITISRLQRDDVSASPALLYSGTIKSCSFPQNGQFAELQIQTIEATTSRAIPRFTYMGQCNHLLFSAGCGVNPASFNHVGIVTLVDGNEITIAGLSASGLDVLGGFVQSTSAIEKRMILAVSGDVITVLLPFENDPDGTTVTAFAGCNRILTEDCAVKFSNEEEFGGFSFVPNRNVFNAGL